jgi:hypothetical protein
VAPLFSSATRYALCHPVSRPSSLRVHALSVKRWGWRSWSAPQHRGQPRTVDPLPVRAGWCRAVRVFETAFVPCCELYLQVLARTLAAWLGAPQRSHQAATGDDVAGGAAPTGNSRVPRRSGRHLTALGTLDLTGGRMGLKWRPAQ